ncbi:hypothetical protein HDV05_007377 [Chytridiales sp. JEL 0842]|nr:hypothetical protein HDV05_007377 [Chytridiales sp. JEL 0842]
MTQKPLPPRPHTPDHDLSSLQSAHTLPFQLSPPQPPPKENLCPHSLNHLTFLIQQSLAEVYLDKPSNPSWKDVLLDIGLQVAADLAFVVDVLGALRQQDGALELGRLRTRVDDLQQQYQGGGPIRSDASLRGMSMSPGRGEIPAPNLRDTLKEYHHVINVLTTPDGHPDESHYIPGQDTTTLQPNGQRSSIGSISRRSFDFKPQPTPPLGPTTPLPSNHPTSIIPLPEELGGTILLNGVPPRDSKPLQKIMHLVVFVACHLKLEMVLYQNHFVDWSTWPLRTALQSKGGEGEGERRRLGKRSWVRQSRNVWAWFKSGLGGDGKEGGRVEQASGDTSDIPGDENGRGVSMDSSNRFERAIQQIEKTVISCSPGVAFPPPHLLVRLRNEEMQEKREWDRGLLRPKSMFLSRASTSSLKADTASSTGSLSSRRMFRAYPASSANLSNISVDSRAGLSYYMTNNNSINGVMRHQSLTFSYSFFWNPKQPIPCQPPKVVSVRYYQKTGEHKDTTLGAFLEELFDCAEAGTPCREPTCPEPKRSHVITYTHQKARISVSIEEANPVSVNVSDAFTRGVIEDGKQILMWMSCKECGKQTPIVPMGEMSWYYSFGKYLELLCYHTQFLPAVLCVHTLGTNGGNEEARMRCRRWFRRGRWVVVVEYEDVELFEMRVPRVQVLPELALKRISVSRREFRIRQGQELRSGEGDLGAVGSLEVGVVDITDNRHDDEKKALGYVADELAEEDELSLLELDIDDTLFSLDSDIATFYNSVRIHLDYLQESLALHILHSQSEPQPNESETTSPAELEALAQEGIKRMRQALDEEENRLLTSIDLFQSGGKNNPLWDLNDVRISISDRMRATAASLEAWQRGCLPPTDAFKRGASLVYPDYCNGPGVYVFPESCVVVREEEPTSILAFALCSKGYLREVKQMRESRGDGAELTTPTGSFVDSPAASPPSTPTKSAAASAANAAAMAAMAAAAGVAESARFDAQEGYRTTIKTFSHELTSSSNGPKPHIRYNDQLVIKQLASNWTHAEKDALLKFAPAYFDYMQNADKNPTVLAKIFGFYTIKQKNAGTGAVRELDVLVMEHLFCNMRVSRKFDLKGVSDRYSDTQQKPSHSGNNSNAGNRSSDGVMWDGDWVDGRYRSLLMLHGHSKKIILDSIRNDTLFLSHANVMDYSLLVGVNDEKKELVVGIVDFIGSYTWYKRLETRGKSAIRASKDVTVIPPVQYGERFRKAMDQYFLMVPDKWIKTSDDDAQPYTLPAVL